MIILDAETDCLPTSEEVWYWKRYVKNKKVNLKFSIPSYLEENADCIRDRYLSFIYELGEKKIFDKTLVDHLSLSDGLSYWWLTLLAEKSPWKSKTIIDVIHWFALEEILLERKPKTLRLISANVELHRMLLAFSVNLSIPYVWDSCALRHRISLFRRFYEKVPLLIRAVMSLFYYLITHFSFKRVKKTSEGINNAVFFCSYLDNVNISLADQGIFSSNYWGGLLSLLRKKALISYWLQIFIPVQHMTQRSVVRWLNAFNQSRDQNGIHQLLENHLSWSVVWRAMKDWFVLIRCARLMKSHCFQLFCPSDSRVSLWPLMKSDWEASFFGPHAVLTLLWVQLFSKAMQSLPKQKKGFYLCEQLVWERILIHFWRQHGHGQLIGVAHATVCFWHLNYFFDKRIFFDKQNYTAQMPVPDYIGVNGRNAMDALITSGYPKEQLAECEALRYDYLSQKRVVNKDKERSLFKVLVLGDYMSSGSKKMLELLMHIMPEMQGKFIFTVKPHPNFPIQASDYPGLDIQIVSDSLDEILPDFDIAYASNLTSAAVDAYLFGLPVIVVVDETELNFSPLRGHKSVYFVNSSEELADALSTASQVDFCADSAQQDFFFLDSELPRWSRLLEN